MIQEGGKEVWYEEEILEFSPCTYLKFALKGGSLGKNPMMIGYKIVPVGDKVTLNYTSNWQPKGLLLKIFHKAITKVSDANAEKELKALKKQIENQE